MTFTSSGILVGKNGKVWDSDCIAINMGPTTVFTDVASVLNIRVAKALGFDPNESNTITVTLGGHSYTFETVVRQVNCDFWISFDDTFVIEQDWRATTLLLRGNVRIPTRNSGLFGSMCINRPIPKVVLYFDGASKGNPGPAGYGYLLQNGAGHGENLVEGYGFLDETTNNISEYEGLIEGLYQAGRIRAQKVMVYGDSELVVRQVTGKYQVKNQGLIGRHALVVQLLRNFGSVEIHHVDRRQNQATDNLANEAVKTRNFRTKYNWDNLMPLLPSIDIGITDITPEDSYVPPWVVVYNES